MTYSELLAETDDFNVANGFFGLIVGQFNDDCDASLYRPIELPIVLIWHADGIISNGGFAYLFEAEWPGDPDYTQTIRAHSDLGCGKQAEALRLAFAIVADTGNRDARRSRFLALPEEEQRKINSMYLGANDDGVPEKHIADYIRRNSKALGYLRGRIS